MPLLPQLAYFEFFPSLMYFWKGVAIDPTCIHIKRLKRSATKLIF